MNLKKLSLYASYLTALLALVMFYFLVKDIESYSEHWDYIKDKFQIYVSIASNILNIVFDVVLTLFFYTFSKKLK